MQTRQTDPISAEVWAIRSAYAARFDYDVEVIKRLAAAPDPPAFDVLPHVPGDGHASPKTTKLSDRTAHTVTVDEI